MTTSQLITQIDAYLKPTQPNQYAVVVSRRFLLTLKAHLELMITVRTVNNQMAIICATQGHSYQSVSGMGIVCAVCGQPAAEQDKKNENHLTTI